MTRAARRTVPSPPMQTRRSVPGILSATALSSQSDVCHTSNPRSRRSRRAWSAIGTAARQREWTKTPILFNSDPSRSSPPRLTGRARLRPQPEEEFAVAIRAGEGR